MSENLLGKTMIRMQTQSLLNQVAIMAGLSRLMSQSTANDDLRKQLQRNYDQTVKLFEEIEQDADAAINKPKDKFNKTSAELLHDLGYRVRTPGPGFDWRFYTPSGIESREGYASTTAAWMGALTYHQTVGEGT